MKKYILNSLVLSIGILSLVFFALPTQKADARDGYGENQRNLEINEQKNDSFRISSDDLNDDKGGLRPKFERNMFGFGENRSERNGEDGDENRKDGLMKKIHEFAKHRYETSVDRIGKLQTRVQSRIDKVKASGKDTTVAQTLLTTSISKLAETKAFIASAKALIDTNTNVVPMPQTVKDQIKDYFTKAKASMKDSFNALKDSVKELKTISGGSSSASSNENSNN